MNLPSEMVVDDKFVGLHLRSMAKKNLQYIRIWFRDYARFREEFGYVENL